MATLSLTSPYFTSLPSIYHHLVSLFHSYLCIYSLPHHPDLRCVCYCLNWLFSTPWTVARQPPVGFPGKNTGVGCHFLSPLPQKQADLSSLKWGHLCLVLYLVAISLEPRSVWNIMLNTYWRNSVMRNAGIWLFTAALLIIAKKLQTAHVSIKRGMEELRYSHWVDTTKE